MINKITFLSVLCFFTITATFSNNDVEKANSSNTENNPNFTLDANGVTCNCDNAAKLETGDLT